MAKARVRTFPAVSPGLTLLVPDPESARRELAVARTAARAWSEALEPELRAELAAELVRHALRSYAARTAARVDDSAALGRQPKLHAGNVELGRRIGELAAVLPCSEGLHAVTSVYPLLLAGDRRSALGAFYTPPALASRLLDQASEEGLDWASARVLDPAAGGGVFLVEAALRMRRAMAQCEPAFVLGQIGARLLGFEIDPHAAALAQSAVEIALADLTRDCGRPLGRVVKVCDSLEEPPHPGFDLVVGNPPYGRVALTPAQRSRFARSLYGHANLYGVFTDLALRWAAADGLVAYLTPTSFLSGQYYRELRGLLAREAAPVAIDFVHARRGVFEDVLQETLLATYRRGATGRRARIGYLTASSDREIRLERNGTVGLPADPRGPWLAPREPGHRRLIERVERMPTRLADLGYSVSTGPLVWNRFKTQLREHRAGGSVHPLIWAESVTADGRFLFRARKRNHTPYFELREGDDWLLVDRPCVLVQRTTAKEQTRRLIAAELPADFVAEHRGVVIENHLNMIRPGRQPKVPPAVIAALLNSRALDDVFRCMNGSVAVSAFELEALPLPTARELQALAMLIRLDAGPRAIEAECDRLYGAYP